MPVPLNYLRKIGKIRMKINYNINSKQQKKGLTIYFAKRFSPLFGCAAISAPMVLYYLLVGLFYSKEAFDYILIPLETFIISLVMYFLSVFILVEIRFAILKHNHSRDNLEIVMYFIDKIIIHEVKSMKTGTYNYSDIKKVIETKHFIIIVLRFYLTQTIPKECLSLNQYGSLKKILMQNKVKGEFFRPKSK